MAKDFLKEIFAILNGEDKALFEWASKSDTKSDKTVDDLKNRLPKVLSNIDLYSQVINKAEQLARTAGTLIYKKIKKKIFIEKVTDFSVFVHVEADTTEHVQIYDDSKRIHVTCECKDFEKQPRLSCQHMVATSLFLIDHYRLPGSKNTPSVNRWELQILELLKRADTPRKKTIKEAILFFNFVKSSYYTTCKVGGVLTSAIPQELLTDFQETKKVLAEYLKQNYLTLLNNRSLFYMTTGPSDSYKWINATPAHLVTAKQEIKASRYPFRREATPNWQLLSDALVIYGTEETPLGDVLNIATEPAKFQLSINKNPQGMAISPVLCTPDSTISLKSNGYEIFYTDPLWICDNHHLVRVKMGTYELEGYLNTGEIIVPKESANEFLSDHFKKIGEVYDIRSENVVDEVITVINPIPRIYLAEEDSELRVELRHAYNEFEFISDKNSPLEHYHYDKEINRLIKLERNQNNELAWRQRFGSAEFGLKWGGANEKKGRSLSTLLYLRAKVHPLDFLTQYVPKMTAAGAEVFGEAELKLLKINRSKPSISFNITSGIDWFDIKALINFGENNVSLPELRKAIRQKHQYIKLADGSVGEIPPDWIEKYRHLFGLSETAGDDMRVSRHHLTLLDQLLTDNQEIVFDKSFQSLRKKLCDFNGVKSQELPAEFKGELRPYQKAAFDWLHFLREMNFGGCLADDMGTGKTVSTLCFLQSIKEKNHTNGNGKKGRKSPPPHLLVLPRSIIVNWEREAQKFSPNLKLLNYSESNRGSDTKEFNKYDVILTTYGILLRDIELLKDYKFDTVILDEAQAVKNPVSESAKAVRLLQCNHKLTLTGTPVENNTLELWSQFAFLNPGMLGSIDFFRTDFATPIEKDKDDSATKTLRRMVYPFILRRTKDQVALDLPPRTEKIMWQEMESDQRKLYEKTRDEYRAQILKLIDDKGEKNARFRILEGLLRLRQICNHPKLMESSYQGSSPKLDSLIETVETLQTEGHKVLIFSQFVKMLKLIEERLKDSAIKYSYLDGSTVNRQKRVDDFQNDETISAFLISLKAGGVGLNLTAADYVIHVDPWWNPAVEIQASDRAHRIGQNKPVFVYKLLMRDSIEEKILQLQERKRDIVKQLITTDGGFFKSLTTDDITSLFS